MITPSRIETLADLRNEIDRIDAALHRLLMERGEIIDRLIEAKARQGGGSAFRPGREADMMRGARLPATRACCRSTRSRASGGSSSRPSPSFSRTTASMPIFPAATRRCAIAAGFISASPFPSCRSPAPTRSSRRWRARSGDLGLVRVEPRRPGLGGAASFDPRAPKIIARLPFVERPDHPAGLPLFVVAQPLAEAAVREWFFMTSNPR